MYRTNNGENTRISADLTCGPGELDEADLSPGRWRGLLPNAGRQAAIVALPPQERKGFTAMM